MTKHEIAVGMIDSRIQKLIENAEDYSLHCETQMAIEMAYALSAIDCKEHMRYTQCLIYIRSRSNEELLARMRRCA
ncbi:hypothetical protein [Pseudomonas folii]|uniref:DUF3077 domain-containing protein n=1 Tax=Pseudomonas folii TaxID=2762593 RepID=A0ABR7ATR7_9PSED|nr:hypothetical protein [Pseudomonas folii]MBC3948318.1 hypothetical protein [Pseudomonas folii]